MQFVILNTLVSGPPNRLGETLLLYQYYRSYFQTQSIFF